MNQLNEISCVNNAALIAMLNNAANVDDKSRRCFVVCSELDNNELTGSIPPSFSSLVKLNDLYALPTRSQTSVDS